MQPICGGPQKQYTIDTTTGSLDASVDCLIWAIGRDPNVEIGLESAGVKINSKGFIQVDE